MAQISDQGTIGPVFASPQKPPRRLACSRCNRQKLQCRWENDKDKACIRCRRASAVCTSSTPRRLGRPIKDRKTNTEGMNVRDHYAQQQEVEYPGSPSRETTTCMTGEGTQLPALGWPTPQTMLASEIFSEIQIPSLENDYPGYFTTSEFGLCSSNSSSPNAVSLTTATDNNTGQVDTSSATNLQPISTGQVQDLGDGNNQDRLPLVNQGSFIQRLWSLQMSLDQQLEQIILTTADYALETSNGSQKFMKTDDSPFPVDHILTSTQTFLGLLYSCTPVLPTEDKTAYRSSGCQSTSSSVTAVVEGCSSQVCPTNLSVTQVGEVDHRLTTLFNGMNTPTICLVVSCYSRLIEIYDEAFKYIHGELQTNSQHKATPQSRLPLLQLGSFHLKDGNTLQLFITVRILLYNLQCLERSMGIDGERVIVHKEGVHKPNKDNRIQADERVGISGNLARTSDKITKVIMALETDGPGGHSGSIDSLRGNIAKVTRLLEGEFP
ncbi:hypothetical protein F4776DRAFT_583056 [Hypoxylon sp. NC0597]|nr:hypothetical protein F4776DRAFT_583056 [Hypoxylon sp. NC0597]